MKRRILIHDYSGHAFPIQLSRHLAARGHEVLHVYSASFQSPRGQLAKQAQDPPTFDVQNIRLDGSYGKYRYVKRRFQERTYGRLLGEKLRGYQPDILIMNGTPLDVQQVAIRVCRKLNIRYIFWIQDIYSIAIKRILKKKLGFIGPPIGLYYEYIEKSLLDRSDHVIVITDDFIPTLANWGVGDHKITVIPNWAPIEDIPALPKQNAWAKEHGLADFYCFIYSGTLGLKHNPKILLELALTYRDQQNTRLVVISEGIGVDWLKSERDRHKLTYLVIMDFQPFEVLPMVLATADTLVAILEPDSGVYSVPSKVLSYLCAQRPLLLAVPRENLAAKIVSESNAGLVVDPKEETSFLDNASKLIEDSQLRERMGRNARAYAEANFQIESICQMFETIIDNVLA